MFSFLLYLITFSFSIIACVMFEKLLFDYPNRYKIAKALLLIIVVTLPCLLAGLRDSSVGVDTAANIIHYEVGKIWGDFSRIHKAYGGGTEILSSALIYVMGKVNASTTMYLFMLEFLTIFPIVIAGYELRNECPMHLVLATFLFCFFNNSLNLGRQSVACSFLVLAWTQLFQKNKHNLIYFFVLSLIAIMFHKGTFFGVTILLLCIFITKSKLKNMLKYTLITLIVLMPVYLPSITTFLLNLGILSERFIQYADIFVFRTIPMAYFLNPFSIYAMTDVFFRVILLSIPAYIIRDEYRIESIYRMTSLVVSIGFFLFLTVLYTMRTNYGQRLSLYLDSFLMIFVPYCCIHSRVKQRKLMVYLLIFSYWVIWVMYYGWSGSETYVFRR